jgi:hypothetical protein
VLSVGGIADLGGGVRVFRRPPSMMSLKLAIQLVIQLALKKN